MGMGNCLIFLVIQSIECMVTYLFIYIPLHLCLFFFRMQGLTESFFDEIKTIPFEDNDGEKLKGSNDGSSRNGRMKKRKACTFDASKIKCGTYKNTFKTTHMKTCFSLTMVDMIYALLHLHCI